MLSFLQIENFKIYQNFNLDINSKISLISGMNAIGKTTILESIYLINRFFDPESLSILYDFRGYALNNISNTSLYDSLFNNNTFNNIKITIKDNRKKSLVLSKPTDNTILTLNGQIAYNKNMILNFSYVSYNKIINGYYNFLNNIFIKFEVEDKIDNPRSVFLFNANLVINQTHLAHILSNIIVNEKIEVVLKHLRLFGDFDSIFILTNGNIPYIYLKKDNKNYPITSIGSGISKILFIIIMIINNPDSIILIDELENGIHHSMFINLWNLLYKLSIDYNCQIIATSHSYECIKSSVIDINPDYDELFNYIRLNKVENEIKPVYFTAETLKGAINKEFEIR
jgi:AAA15 family ATPase/GTPase